MKCLIFFASLMFILACGGGASGPKFDTKGYDTENIGGGAQFAEFRDANGWALSKGPLQNGVRTGTWMTYHENSHKIKTITSYINGVKNGVQININDRGQIETVTEYKNDQLHGLSAKYTFGRPTEETNYRNGKIDGMFAIYDSQGKVQRKGELKDGQYHGKLQYFDESGNVTMEYEYKNGEKISGGIVEKPVPAE